MATRSSTNRLKRHILGAAASGLLAAATLLVLAGTSSASVATSSGAGTAGRIFTIAGALRWTGPAGKSNLATATSMVVTAVAAEPGGGFLIADVNDYYGYALVHRVWPDGRTTVVAGGGGNDPSKGGPATAAQLGDPEGLAVLPSGGFLIADAGSDVIERVARDGRISVVAGGGGGGDGGPATGAFLNNPMGVAALPHGGFLIADEYASSVRHVWPDGHISTVRITGVRRQQLDPVAIAVLPHGGFLLADEFGGRIWKVAANGHASVAAGNGRDGDSGDGGRATRAAIGYPRTVAVEPHGGFLIGSQAPSVRRVWPDGHITTVVGAATSPFSGDGGAVSHAELYGPPNSAPAVIALPHSGMLIGYGNTVRLVVGTHGTKWLAAAMRPLRSYVTAHAYQVRVELTHAAHLVLGLYVLGRRRPVAVAHAHRKAGSSEVTIKLPAHIQPGLYGVDLRASAGHAATRAEQWVYLGERLTARTLEHIEAQTLMSGVSSDPRQSFYVNVGPCREFSRSRVDCVINDSNYTLFVQSLSLTPEGQLRARDYVYRRRHHSPFRLTPKWQGPSFWWDLGAAWAPYPMSSY